MATEKRLIDADSLMERFRVVAQSGGPVVVHVSDICAAIEDEVYEGNVDAVEVVRGRWVSSGGGFDCCSKCRKVYADGYFTAMGIKPRAQFNYCPNCGAKMDGGK